MWPLLVGTAFAGLHADLTAATARGPAVSVACTSGTEASDRLGRLMSGLGRELPDLPPWWRSVAGGSLVKNTVGTGMVRASVWLDPPAVEFAFETAVAVDEVALLLAEATGGAAAADEGGWLVTGSDGDALRVTGSAGTVAIGSPHIAEGSLLAPGPEVIGALPESEGCAFVAQVPMPEVGPVVLGVHFPFAPRTATTFVVGSASLPDLAGIHPQLGAPPPVHTRSTPDGVLVLGLGLDGVDFSAFLTGSTLQDARRLQRRLPLTAGASVALFQREPEPLLGAALPIAGHASGPALARRLRALAKRLDSPPVMLDRTHLLVTDDSLTLYIATERGRILVANDPGLLAEMEVGQGEPWVHGRAAELASRFPLVGVSSVLPDGDDTLRTAEPITLGLGLEGGLVRGELFVPLTIEEFAAFTARAAEARRRRKAAPDGAAPAGEADGV